MKTASLLTLALGCLAGAHTAQAQSPPHHLAAVELLNQITTLQSLGIYTDSSGTPLNRYGGNWNSATDPSYIQFADLNHNVLPGNHTKCSPLVTHLFKSVYNWNWKNYSFYDPVLKVTKSTASPAPYQYIALVKEGKGFTQRVLTLNQAQPGDILSWWTVGSDANDHTMIISSVNWNSVRTYPSQLPGAISALAGTVFVEVQVIDSSADLHTADSRLVNVNGTLQHLPGIGTGTIGLLINSNFEIVGRTWSLPTSDYYTQPNGWLSGLHSRLRLAPANEIVIGRMPSLP
jgi:hypothetical protein